MNSLHSGKLIVLCFHCRCNEGGEKPPSGKNLEQKDSFKGKFP